MKQSKARTKPSPRTLSSAIASLTTQSMPPLGQILRLHLILGADLLPARGNALAHTEYCVKLGAALKEAIAEYPEDLRVGVLASGGLSHFAVDERMDRSIIDALRAKDHAFLGALDPRKLKAGSSEIRNWLVVAGAAGALDMSWHSYTPAYRTPALTGTLFLGITRRHVTGRLYHGDSVGRLKHVGAKDRAG